MTELQNCKRCRKTFQSNGLITVCPDCKEKDDVEFDSIRMYLFGHPQAKIFEVSTHLDIPVNTIKRFLREGRLEIVEKNNMFLRCEMCGCAIQSGHYCDECTKQLKQGYTVSCFDSRPSKHDNKIRFLSHENRDTRKLAAR